MYESRRFSSDTHRIARDVMHVRACGPRDHGLAVLALEYHASCVALAHDGVDKSVMSSPAKNVSVRNINNSRSPTYPSKFQRKSDPSATPAACYKNVACTTPEWHEAIAPPHNTRSEKIQAWSRLMQIRHYCYPDVPPRSC